MKWKDEYLARIKSMSNEECFDEYKNLMAGDSWDGAYSKRGEWEWQEIQKEFDSRLKKVIFYESMDETNGCVKDDAKVVKSILAILVENWQAQIAGFYNDDKTDIEKMKRNAVIEEYQDLIQIIKHKFLRNDRDKVSKS